MAAALCQDSGGQVQPTGNSHMVLVMSLKELSVVKDVCPTNVELGMSSSPSIGHPGVVWS